jgi:hypothetical protein
VSYEAPGKFVLPVTIILPSLWSTDPVGRSSEGADEKLSVTMPPFGPKKGSNVCAVLLKITKKTIANSNLFFIKRNH